MRRTILAFSSVLVLLALSLASLAEEKKPKLQKTTPQGDGRRIALLIGNNTYAKAVGPLSSSHQTIEQLAAALQKTGFAKGDITIVYNTGRKALQKAVRAHAAKLKQAGKGALGFFYFRGHTANNTEFKTNVLLPVDVKELNEELWDEAVATSYITDKLQRGAPNTAHFVIFNTAGRALDLGTLKNAANGMAVQKAPDHMLLAFVEEKSKREDSQTKGLTLSFAAGLARQITKPDVVVEDIFKSLGIATRSVGGKSWMSASKMPQIYFAGRSKKDPKKLGQEKRLALLIGNSRYRPGVGALKNPHNDVHLLKKSLEQVGFEVTLVEDVGREKLLASVQTFTKQVKAAGEQAVALFYYAGHGAANPQNKFNYLLPVDLENSYSADMWQKSVRLDELLTSFKDIGSNIARFIIFDACRNELNIAGGSSGKQNDKDRGSRPPGKQIEAAKPKNASGLKAGGFQPMLSDAGMLLAFATAPGQTASDGSGNNGPYAKALSEELLKPGISAIDVFINVQLRVKEKIGQDPWLSFPAIARVFFNGSTSPAEIEKQKQESLKLAVLSQQATKEGDAVTGMLLALEALPDKKSKEKVRRERPWLPEAELALNTALDKAHEFLLIKGSHSALKKATFSKDGKLLMTLGTSETYSTPSAKNNFRSQKLLSTDNKVVRLFNTSSGRLLTLIKKKFITNAVFSPDGNHFLTWTGETAVAIRATRGGKTIAVLNQGDDVNSANFSPDGKNIVTLGDSPIARIWKRDSPRKPRLLIGHEGWLNSASFSPDSQYIITASNDKTARIWGIKNARQLTILAGHKDQVWMATFSPDGKLAATGSKDGTARIWDVRSGKELAVLATSKKNNETIDSMRGVDAIGFSKNSGLFFASSYSSTKVWETKNWHRLSTLRKKTGSINSLDFSPNGKLMVTSNADSADDTACAISVWDVKTGERISFFRGHRLEADDLTDDDNCNVASVSFSPDGKLILSASNDRTARLWKLENGKQRATLIGHNKNNSSIFAGIRSAHITPNEKFVISSSYSDHTVRIWDIQSGKELLKLKHHGLSNAFLSPNGQFIVATHLADARKSLASVWRFDQKTYTARKTLTIDILGSDISFSHNSSLIAFRAGGDKISIWNIKKRHLQTSLMGHCKNKTYCGISNIAFSPDDTLIVTTAGDKSIRVPDYPDASASFRLA